MGYITIFNNYGGGDLFNFGHIKSRFPLTYNDSSINYLVVNMTYSDNSITIDSLELNGLSITEEGLAISLQNDENYNSEQNAWVFDDQTYYTVGEYIVARAMGNLKEAVENEQTTPST